MSIIPVSVLKTPRNTIHSATLVKVISYYGYNISQVFFSLNGFSFTEYTRGSFAIFCWQKVISSFMVRLARTRSSFKWCFICSAWPLSLAIWSLLFWTPMLKGCSMRGCSACILQDPSQTPCTRLYQRKGLALSIMRVLWHKAEEQEMLIC